MYEQVEKPQKKKSQSASASSPQMKNGDNSTFRLWIIDQKAIAQRKLQDNINNGSKVSPVRTLQNMANEPVQLKTDTVIQLGKEGDSEVDKSENSFSEEHKKLTPHIEKLARERQELEKWNLDGTGRNQGLRHIIDYAYAPPSKAASNNKLTEYGAMANQVFGPNDITKHNINRDQGIKDKYIESVGTTENGNRINNEINKLEREQLDAMAGTKSATEKKKIGTSPAYNDRKRRIKSLKADLAEESKYALTQDESKKGRLKEMEKINPLPVSGIKGKEIETVTSILEEVEKRAKVTRTSTVDGATRTIKAGGWIKANKKGKWVKQPQDIDKAGGWIKATEWVEQSQDIVVPDTAASADYEENGLKVKKWGATPDSMRFSTMMGASKSKEK